MFSQKKFEDLGIQAPLIKDLLDKEIHDIVYDKFLKIIYTLENVDANNNGNIVANKLIKD